MFSFQSVTLTVPDSSCRVADATCPGPNFVCTSLGVSISTIYPFTSTLLIPGFSSAIFISLFSFHYLAGREIVPHAGDSNLDLVPCIGPGDEYYEIVEAGDSISSSPNRINCNIHLLTLFDRYGTPIAFRASFSTTSAPISSPAAIASPPPSASTVSSSTTPAIASPSPPVAPAGSIFPSLV